MGNTLPIMLAHTWEGSMASNGITVYNVVTVLPHYRLIQFCSHVNAYSRDASVARFRSSHTHPQTQTHLPLLSFITLLNHLQSHLLAEVKPRPAVSPLFCEPITSIHTVRRGMGFSFHSGQKPFVLPSPAQRRPKGQHHLVLYLVHRGDTHSAGCCSNTLTLSMAADMLCIAFILLVGFTGETEHL